MHDADEPHTRDFDPAEVHKCAGCGEPVILAPGLSCKRCNLVHPLRCFYYKAEPGVFVAECIDLNLMTEAATAEKAIVALQEQMFSYLEVAYSGDPQGLIWRKSPISHRLRYHWHGLKRFLAGKRHRHGDGDILYLPHSFHQQP